MNRLSKNTFLLFVMLFAIGTSASTTHSASVTTDRVLSDEGMPLDRGWRYHAGDDPAWAAPEFNDGGWQELEGSRVAPPGGVDGWGGIGWFRVSIEVPEALRNRVLALGISGLGAMEFYFDGQLVRTLGHVAPSGGSTVEHLNEVPVMTPVALDGRPQHVLAVRYATGNRPDYEFPTHPTAGAGGFSVSFATPDAILDAHTWLHINHTSLYTLAGSAAMTIAILHLLFFAFYPRQIGHLYYALFTMFAAAIAYVPVNFMRVHDLGDYVMWARLWQVSLAMVSVMGIRFLYAIFYDRMPKLFWLWLAAAGGVVIIYWNGPLMAVLYFSLVTFIEILRVLIIAVIRRKPYAGLIAIGVAAFILSSAVQIVRFIVHQMTTQRDADDGPQLYLFGLLAMLIIMSVGLALGYAKINKNLAAKLEEVEKLSADRLEQERRAKEQEMERLRLEADNALKEIELEEAHKRQKVLDELAVTNQELRQTQTQLVQSEKMAALGNLVAGVAHEINTPVGAISSMHDTMVRAVGKLKKEIPDKDEDGKTLRRTIKVIEDANDVIQTGSARVTTIVRRLRSFARLDEAEIKKVDIHEGLEDTLTLVHHELKHHVIVHRNYGRIPEIECYPGQLNQVFLNMLVNANQAIEGNGDITITTSLKGDKVHVEFKDTGRGISPENLKKVFDPGFTTKGVGVGTGLGLSICYRIIQDHKGEILVGSTVGEGTTFTIVLPMDLD